MWNSQRMGACDKVVATCVVLTGLFACTFLWKRAERTATPPSAPHLPVSGEPVKAVPPTIAAPAPLPSALFPDPLLQGTARELGGVLVRCPLPEAPAASIHLHFDLGRDWYTRFPEQVAATITGETIWFYA